MKRLKSFASMFLVIVMLFTIAPTVLAADIDATYPSTNMIGYILSTSDQTAVAYSSINGSPLGHIYARDKCTIQAVYTNGWIKVVVPWSGYPNGRTVYTERSNFINSVAYTPWLAKANTYTPAYSRLNLSQKLGRVYAGDNCYVVNEVGNYYQVLCPWDGGVYYLCWAAKSAFGGGGHTHTYVREFEALHPHKVYEKCYSCGDYHYTGETEKAPNCTICNPTPNNSIDSKINSFLSDGRFRNGVSWGYYKKPILSSHISIGCCAYVSDFIKYVYNVGHPQDGKKYYSASEIRKGDVVYCTPMHWIVVTGRSGNTIQVAEGNYNSRVHIGSYTLNGNQICNGNRVYKTFQYGYHY